MMGKKALEAAQVNQHSREWHASDKTVWEQHAGQSILHQHDIRSGMAQGLYNLPPREGLTTTCRHAPQACVTELGLEGQLTAEAFLGEREKALDKMFPDTELMPGVPLEPFWSAASFFHSSICRVLGSHRDGSTNLQSPLTQAQSACCGICTRTACPSVWRPPRTNGTTT